jgi:hypothetical protein
MNFTQTFEEFSGSLGPTDLLLYAGLGIVLWVLFKDQLSPAQKFLTDLLDKAKDNVPSVPNIVAPSLTKPENTKNVFLDLVVSWKQTRDLAEKSGCTKAVEVADQMFPYLSPTVCDGENNDTK